MGKLSDKFAHCADAVARNLLGQPTFASPTELRWGRKGSLVVHIAGQRAGRFHDYGSDCGGDLIDLICRLRGVSTAAALQWLTEFTTYAAIRLPAATVADIEAAPGLRWSRKAQGLWDHSIPLPGTLGESYLRGRCCFVPGAHDLRYLDGHGKHPPAIVARVSDFQSGEPLTLHFIRLDNQTGGKISGHERNGNLTGHVNVGGVVRLVPCIGVGSSLGLAEGIETALSVFADRGEPVWATLGAGNMAKLAPMPIYERVHIWADHDDAGIKAARALASRWTSQGHDMRVILPGISGQDWNDVVLANRADERI